MPLLRSARPFWLAAALAVSAQAGVVRAPSPVYAPPAMAWAGPLGAAFADPMMTGLIPISLAVPNSATPEALRATAPLVVQLAQSLSLTPEKFAILAPAEKKAVLELAAEAAREEMRAKVYALAERAHVLSSPGKELDREARADLYGTVARLMEVRDHYGAWLDESEHAAVEDSYRLASTRAWEVRSSLIRDSEAPLDSRPAPPQITRPATAFVPGHAARQLRASMEASKNGWGQSDLDALYTGYGFVLRQGGKHRFYSHPDFPQLHETVSRQNELPPGYAQSALKLIAELERLSAPTKAAAPAASGPPATLNLEDLSVLLSPPAAKTPPPKPAVERPRSRAPPRVAAPAVVKTAPVAPAPRLAAPTPKAAEAKAEPPPASPPSQPNSWMDRAKNLLNRLKKKPH